MRNDGNVSIAPDREGVGVRPDLSAEMKTFADVGGALADASPETARRVLAYYNDVYGVSTRQTVRLRGDDLPAAGDRRFPDFPSLFDAADPADGLERALVAAYWDQVVQGADDFESQSINSALKNLGHPSRNITRDLDHLMARTPHPVMQVGKSGASKQGRKRYKLTREGIRVVESMLAPEQRGNA